MDQKLFQIEIKKIISNIKPRQKHLQYSCRWEQLLLLQLLFQEINPSNSKTLYRNCKVILLLLKIFIFMNDWSQLNCILLLFYF
ncbi:hypothetical protein pb186bvf_010145 [Paramecium bursaria]